MDSNKKKTYDASRLGVMAMFVAISYVAVCVFHIKVQFLTFDIKDALIAVAGMLYGPLAAVEISITVALIELLTISETGLYGFVMNVLSSVAFTATSAIIYKYVRNLYGAILGLVSGVMTVTAVMMAFNLIVTPFYMGVPVGEVAKLIPTLLLPFNFIKAIMNASIVMMIYKPIVTALRRAGAIKGSETAHGYKLGKKSVLVTLVSVLIMAASLAIFFIIMGAKAEWLNIFKK